MSATARNLVPKESDADSQADSLLARPLLRVRGNHAGFSVVELLIVLAIVGTLAGVGFVFGRQILQGQENRSAINTVQQSVWQGATAAASRGITAELFRNGRVLQVRNQATSAVIRSFELPPDVVFNLPDGASLVFTPPGKIDLGSMANLPSLTLQANGKTYSLQVSLIGEVKVELQ